MLTFLYVDDLLITGSATDIVLQVKQNLSKQFEMVGCDKTQIWFGLETARDQNKLSLKICQLAYSLKILEVCSQQKWKPVSTHIENRINKAIYVGMFFCSTNYSQTTENFMCLIFCSRPTSPF